MRTMLPVLWLAGVLTQVPQGDAVGQLEQPTAVEEEKALRVGGEMAAALMVRLQGELRAAMQQGGPVQAISVCSERALPVTMEVASVRPGASLKRVTSRRRNPANTPDRFETEALQVFEAAVAAGGPMPAHIVQKVRRGDTAVLRYYQPLTAAGLCLVCHGDPDRMPEELRSVLRQRYPEDQAIGYMDGQFRGAIRVEFPAE